MIRELLARNTTLSVELLAKIFDSEIGRDYVVGYFYATFDKLQLPSELDNMIRCIVDLDS